MSPIRGCSCLNAWWKMAFGEETLSSLFFLHGVPGEFRKPQAPCVTATPHQRGVWVARAPAFSLPHCPNPLLVLLPHCRRPMTNHLLVTFLHIFLFRSRGVEWKASAYSKSIPQCPPLLAASARWLSLRRASTLSRRSPGRITSP